MITCIFTSSTVDTVVLFFIYFVVSDVKIETHKLSWQAQPRIRTLDNLGFKPSKSMVKIQENKLSWKAEPRVGSLQNVKWKPSECNKKFTQHHKLNWKAEPKVSTLDNLDHVPGGGARKYREEPVEWKAEPKVRTRDNLDYVSCGGDKIIKYQVVKRRFPPKVSEDKMAALKRAQNVANFISALYSKRFNKSTDNRQNVVKSVTGDLVIHKSNRHQANSTLEFLPPDGDDDIKSTAHDDTKDTYAQSEFTNTLHLDQQIENSDAPIESNDLHRIMQRIDLKAKSTKKKSSAKRIQGSNHVKTKRAKSVTIKGKKKTNKAKKSNLGQNKIEKSVRMPSVAEEVEELSSPSESRLSKSTRPPVKIPYAGQDSGSTSDKTLSDIYNQFARQTSPLAKYKARKKVFSLQHVPESKRKSEVMSAYNYTPTRPKQKLKPPVPRQNMGDVTINVMGHLVLTYTSDDQLKTIVYKKPKEVMKPRLTKKEEISSVYGVIPPRVIIPKTDLLKGTICPKPKWKPAKPKIDTLSNLKHQPQGGKGYIYSKTLDFKTGSTPKVSTFW